ncbi:MAG TPA: 4'-phosphopantetheinyl transferase superfamily protein [Puia sp.]|nr:4'-phosphopantetheinyl transferase superfamily protein [Puia sp.]
MSSAGNDIVALAAIDKQRTHHSRFYSKILADAERPLFDSLQPGTMSFENFVWLLWSIKESVYKYLKRTEPGLLFAPAKIHIRKIELPRIHADLLHDISAAPLRSVSAVSSEETQWESRGTGPGDESYKGIALFESRIFYFRSKIHPDFIATVVNSEESFENIWWGVQSIGHSDYTHQSLAVRSFALNKLNAVLFAGRDAAGKSPLQIGKSPLGYPLLLKDTREMTIPLSFAHHANFVAYSFNLALPPQ